MVPMQEKPSQISVIREKDTNVHYLSTRNVYIYIHNP